MGIAQAYGEGSAATVNVGFKPEEIALMLQAAGSASQAKIDELAGNLNTSREAVLGFLRTLKEDDVPTEQLASKLALIAQRYVSMMERLAALDPEDSEAGGYIDEARQVLRHAAFAKDYERADALLSNAEDAQGRSLGRVEALEREAREAANRLLRGQAATRVERAELALTRLDYLLAAQHFQAAAGLVAAEDSDLRFEYLVRSALALASHGDEKGENVSFIRAIEANREILQEYTRERAPLAWAMTQDNLGNALRGLGERESGTERLKEAVAACREALKERTRERLPLDWAATQNNLGSALAILGWGESGSGSLEEAVVAYREALKEYTRERVPQGWASTQINLGNALGHLGLKENGTDRLEEAVVAYREALKEVTREQSPLGWATTQNNLGFSLFSLGVQEGGTGRLEEAVVALREALLERTRERMPLYWATTPDQSRERPLGDRV
jgi:tetratricopeptide (TPR) repeat protein